MNHQDSNPILGEEEFQQAMENLLDADFLAWGGDDTYLTGGLAVDPRWWSQQTWTNEGPESRVVDPRLLTLSTVVEENEPVVLVGEEVENDDANDEGESDHKDVAQAENDGDGEVVEDYEDEDEYEYEEYDEEGEEDDEEDDEEDGEEVIHIDLIGDDDQGWDDVLRQDNTALVEDVPMEESDTVPTPTENETARVSYRILNHRLQNGVRLIYQIQPDPELPPVHLTRPQALMLPQWESCERAYWRNRPMRHKTWERFQRSGLYTEEQLALFAVLPTIQHAERSNSRGVCLLCQREL